MENKQPASLVSHLISILLLPFNVTVVIPSLVLFFFNNTLGWGLISPVFFLVFSAGFLVLIAGILLVIVTVFQFAKKGNGTLAPWNPPNKLVVSGPYQYSRNPMISGVVLILLGEVLIFGSWPLVLWFVSFTVVNYSYFIFGEEPHLHKKFGEDYAEYKRNVPRMVPRRTPWNPEEK